MTLNLLGQNLLLILCGITTTLFIFVIKFLIAPIVVKKNKKLSKYKLLEQHQRKRRQIILLNAAFLVSICLAFGLLILFSRNTDSTLPVGLAVMMLPTSISFSLLIVTLCSKPMIRQYFMGAGFLLVSLAFSLTLVNAYYRYYPTLGSVFNKNEATALRNNLSKQVTVAYSSPNGLDSLNNTSLEYSLTSITSQPTDGKLYRLTIPGTVSKFHARDAYVYVPSIYSNPSSVKLPVVVLTIGTPGAPTDWINSGLQKTMNTFALHHDGITPLVFVVDDTGAINNDTECVDSPKGNVETYLTIDVPNYIKANFNTEKDSSHWAIGGLSMGGTCSIMLTLRHPDVYHYFMDYGGEMAPEDGDKQKTIKTLFNGSGYDWQQHQPDYLLKAHTYKNMGGFFSVGNSDVRSVTDAASVLSTDSHNAGIETIYQKYQGNHSFDVWQESFKQSLPWVSNRIGATECQTTCD